MEPHDQLAAFEASLAGLRSWEARWPAFAADPSLDVPPDRLQSVLAELTERLKDSYPFFHPRYAGQMLAPPAPVAQLAYALAMRINPNNHALDGGPATSALERDVVGDLARMVGYPASYLGHLTSGGTVANLEALWIAREMQPGRAVAYSRQAHYVHARACDLLGVRAVAVPADARGRMDLDALADCLRSENVGTVVATIGTTGLGAVDAVDEIVPLARAHGARVHADAAYGGFFALVARHDPPPVAPAPFAALAACDSIVIDPHKRGLQPYGCGTVLFRDPAVGRVYQHESPATYFTSAELHLGEISLECSRAGAAAAALWATLRCFPLQPESGLGTVLARTRAAALAWATRIRESEYLRLVVDPELDILAFFPVTAPLTASAISAATDHLFATLMADPGDPVYLAKLMVDRPLLAANHRDVVWDQPTTTVLRSVLMKPEHLAAVDALHAAVERHAARL